MQTGSGGRKISYQLSAFSFVAVDLAVEAAIGRMKLKAES